MLEIVIKLMEKLTELAKLAESRRRVAFDKTVAPTFEEFQRLHDEQLARFATYRAMLLGESHAIPEVIDIAEGDRLVLMSRRLSVLRQAAAMKGREPLRRALERYVVWDDYRPVSGASRLARQGCDAGYFKMMNPGFHVIQGLTTAHLEWLAASSTRESLTRGRDGSSIIPAAVRKDMPDAYFFLPELDHIIAESQKRFAVVVAEFARLRTEVYA